MHPTHDRPSALPWQAAFTMLMANALIQPRELFILFHAAQSGFGLPLWTLAGHLLAPTVFLMCMTGILALGHMERSRLRGYAPAWSMLLTFGITYLAFSLIAQEALSLVLMTMRIVGTDPSLLDLLDRIVIPIRALLMALCTLAAWWTATKAFGRQVVAASAPVNHRLRAAAMFALGYLGLYALALDACAPIFLPQFPWFDHIPLPTLLLAGLVPAGLAMLGAWFGLPPTPGAVPPARLLIAALLAFALATVASVGIFLMTVILVLVAGGAGALLSLVIAPLILPALVSLGVTRLLCHPDPGGAAPT